VACSIAACTVGVFSRFAVGQPSSFEPRLKPVTTVAANCSGVSSRRTAAAVVVAIGCAAAACGPREFELLHFLAAAHSWLIHDSGRGKSSDQDAKKMMIRPMMDQLR
jgi:hypothetical protein